VTTGLTKKSTRFLESIIPTKQTWSTRSKWIRWMNLETLNISEDSSTRYPKTLDTTSPRTSIQISMTWIEASIRMNSNKWIKEIKWSAVFKAANPWRCINSINKLSSRLQMIIKTHISKGKTSFHSYRAMWKTH
jgi:hypothetical protein